MSGLREREECPPLLLRLDELYARISLGVPSIEQQPGIRKFCKEVHKDAVSEYAALRSKEYARPCAVSLPILAMNFHAIAAMTVPTLLRIGYVV